jgi:hypothetical protein
MTTQLTIRGVDDQLRQALEAEAQARGLSLNRCVVVLLRQATGIAARTGHRPTAYGDLDALAGTWTEVEAAEFDQLLAEQRTIDPELWR